MASLLPAALCPNSVQRIATLTAIFCVSLLSYCGPASAQVTVVPAITTVAGNGTAGYGGDGGPATSAEVNDPLGVAVDGAGNIYIADTKNNLIREISAATGIITTVAGDGTAGYSGDGGPATSAELNGPAGVALDSAGNLYIADTQNSRIRKVAAATGTITTVAGDGDPRGGGVGGQATSAEVGTPASVTVDSAGDLYIADEYNNWIWKVTASTGVATVVAGGGSPYRGQPLDGNGGPATSAELNTPTGVALDSAGNLYIADYGDHSIRKVNASTGIITAIAGDGSVIKEPDTGDGGPAISATLSSPIGVAVDTLGNIYIADYARVREITTATGIINTVVGNGTDGYSGDGGPAIGAEINIAQGVALGSNGDLYIADTGNNRIRKTGPFTFNSARFPSAAVGHSTTHNVLLELTADQGISSITAATSEGGVHEYTAGSVTGCVVDGSTVNASGTICAVPITFTPAYPGQRNIPLTVVTDTGTYKIALNGVGTGSQLSFTPGIISTVAGNGTGGYSGDGGPAIDAEIDEPEGLTIDSSGNLYFADRVNNRIRKVTASPGIISTVAGNGTGGYSGDGGPAIDAELDTPSGVVVDTLGNLYIADEDNNRVREVNAATGTITTVAGNGTTGDSGDGGPATSAELDQPEGVAVDGDGNLYIADSGNDRIREVNAATGIISTIAGNGTAGDSGDGGPAIDAELNVPVSLSVDSVGNVYIAASFGNRIRKVNLSTGIISTIAGNGTAGDSGDGGPAIDAELNGPVGVALDGLDNIYIADQGDNLIREMNAATGTITTVAGNGASSSRNGNYNGDGIPATSAALDGPNSVAVDGVGHVYIADEINNRVREVDLITAPLITFKTPTDVGQTDDTDGPQTVVISNIGNMPLTFTTPSTGNNPSYPANFPENGDDANLCSSSSPPLAAGASCDLSMNFQPTGAGANTGSVVLTDDTGNSTGATQTISLSGTGLTSPTITWATPTAITYGTALSSAQLDATASVPGTFAYSPAAGAILSADSQTLSVTFTPTDTTDYTTATASVALAVSTAPVLIATTSTINPSTYGKTVTFTFTVTGVSGGTVPSGSLALSGPGVPANTTVALNASGIATYATPLLPTGTDNITAVYSGDVNYH